MVSLILNTNIFFGDKIFIPQRIEISLDKIYVKFDKILPSDTVILQKIIDKIKDKLNRRTQYSIIFDKDIVMVMTGYGTFKNTKFVIDRITGKIIFDYSYYFDGTGIEYLIETIPDNEVTIYIQDNNVEVENWYDEFEYKNFNKGTSLFEKYLIREIKNNIRYCKNLTTKYNIKINFSFRITSPFGTIHPYLMRFDEIYTSFRTTLYYPLVQPKYLCEFISKITMKNVKEEQLSMTPIIISGIVINNEFFNPLGKYEVKYVNDKNKYGEWYKIVTNKYDKDYPINALREVSEIIDVNNLTSISTYIISYDTISMFSYNNELKYISIDNPVSITRDIDKYVQKFEEITLEEVEYDNIKELLDDKTLIKIINIMERLTPS